MLARFGRWLTLIVAAWALRREVPAEELLTALGKSHPRRDNAWRLAVINDAIARNERKASVTHARN